jgi:hypothetical protein
MEPGAVELFRGMEGWAELVDDFSPMWKPATSLIRRHHGRTFASEGAATGGGVRKRWAPLTTRYAALKARDFPFRPILERTVALRRAMVEGGPGSRTSKTTQSLTVGTRGDVARIAGYHQKGTPRMVARPPMQFDADIRAENSLGGAIKDMIQLVVVNARRVKLANRVWDVSAIEKQGKSLERISRRKTR